MGSIAYKLWESIKKQVAENPEQEEYKLNIASGKDLIVANQLHNAGFIHICFSTAHEIIYTTIISK